MTSLQRIPPSPVVPNHTKVPPAIPHRPFSDPSRLAPEDAFHAHTLPRRQLETNGSIDSSITNGSLSDVRAIGDERRKREKERGRSRSRKRKGVWKKLLWVKQSCTSPARWTYFYTK